MSGGVVQFKPAGGITMFADYDAARSYSGSVGDSVYVQGFANPRDGGQGFFEVVSNSGDINDDDGGINLVNTTDGTWLVRSAYTNLSEINVNWFGILPTSARVDNKAALLAMITRYPLSPLFWPMGIPNNRYWFSAVDVQNELNYTTIRDYLGGYTETQKDNWEYKPHWRGEHGVGEPEEPCTRFGAFEDDQDYLFRFSRRSGAFFFSYARFTKLCFWGRADSTNYGTVKSLIQFDDTGMWVTFDQCEFRYADCGLWLEGVFYPTFRDCIIGDRAHSDTSQSKRLNVGVYMVDKKSYCGAAQFINCNISAEHCGVLSDNRLNVTGNPSIGDYYEGCDLENNSRLTLYYVHAAYGWQPAQIINPYYEKQPAQDPANDSDPLSPGPGLIDLSRFSRTNSTTGNGRAKDLTAQGLTDEEESFIGEETSPGSGDFTAPIRYADSPEIQGISGRYGIQIIGRGFWRMDNMNEPLTLRTDPQTRGLQNDTPNPVLDQNGPVVHLISDRADRDHQVDDDSILQVEWVHSRGTFGGTRNTPAKRFFKQGAMVDELNCTRVEGLFVNFDDTAGDVLGHQWGSALIDPTVTGSGSSTKVELPGESPVFGFGSQITLLSGSGQDEELHIGGNGGSLNYMTVAESPDFYQCTTFHIRAHADQTLPLKLWPRNSRRAYGQTHQQPIVINDYGWHAYAIVSDRGQGAYSYYLAKKAAEPEQKFIIGDIQHLPFSRRAAMDEFLMRRCQAVGKLATNGTPSLNVEGRAEMWVPAMSWSQWKSFESALEYAPTAETAEIHLSRGGVGNGGYTSWDGTGVPSHSGTGVVSDMPIGWQTGTNPNLDISREDDDVYTGRAALRVTGPSDLANSRNNYITTLSGNILLTDPGRPYIVSGIAKRLSGTDGLYMTTGFEAGNLLFNGADADIGEWYRFVHKYDHDLRSQGEIWIRPATGEEWIIDHLNVYSIVPWWR